MKAALFAFNGDAMCFVHVLLNAMEMKENGFEDVQIVVEGSATKLIDTFRNDPDGMVAKLYRKVKDAGLIGCVCHACAAKLGAKEAAEAEGLPLCGEMSGHPSMSRYLKDGYQVFTF